MEAENLLRSGPARPTCAPIWIPSAASLKTDMNEIRNMALLLRPSMLDDFGLVPALEWQGREVSQAHRPARAGGRREMSDDLPEEHKTCIYRVVQEALQQLRPACAAPARSRWRCAAKPRRSCLRVQDDGRGFDTARVRGLGLLGMEERVTHLGGRFRDRLAARPRDTAERELPLRESKLRLAREADRNRPSR